MPRTKKATRLPKPRGDNPFSHAAFPPGDVFGVEVTGGGPKQFFEISGSNWALQASMMRRANEPQAQEPMRAVIIVTLRSLSEDGDIYNEGARALASANWVTRTLPLTVPINVTS